MPLPSIRLVSPTYIRGTDTHDRPGDAGYFVGQGWYGTGLTFQDVYIVAGSTTTLIYEARDANGAPMSGAQIQLNVGKEWAFSTASFNDNNGNSTTTAVNENIQLIITGTTNSNGQVTFILNNTNTDAQAEAAPSAYNLAPTTTSGRFSQVAPQFPGVPYSASALDMVEFHIIPSSGSGGGDNLVALTVENRFTGTVTMTQVPRRGLNAAVMGDISSYPEGTRVALYAIGNWDGNNHMYGPKKSATVGADGAFEIADWSSSHNDANGEYFALIVCNPGVAIPSYNNGEIIDASLYTFITRKTTTITAEVPRRGVGYAITGTVSVTSVTDYTGYKITSYGLYLDAANNNTPHLYGPRNIVDVSGDGTFLLGNWAQYDINTANIILYAFPAGESAPVCDDTVLPEQLYTMVSREVSTGTVSILATGPGIGLTTPITGYVLNPAPGDKVVAYALVNFTTYGVNGVYEGDHAYGPKGAVSTIGEDGSFSISNWASAFVSGTVAYDDAFIGKFLLYVLPAKFDALPVVDSSVAAVAALSSATLTYDRPPITAEACLAYANLYPNAQQRIDALAATAGALDFARAKDVVTTLLKEHTDAAKAAAAAWWAQQTTPVVLDAAQTAIAIGTAPFVATTNTTALTSATVFAPTGQVITVPNASSMSDDNAALLLLQSGTDYTVNVVSAGISFSANLSASNTLSINGDAVDTTGTDPVPFQISAENGTNYDMEVISVGGLGLRISGSTPSAVRGLTSLEPTVAHQISLQWQAPLSTGSSAITGYSIDWTDSSAQVGPSVLSYTATGLSDNTPYMFTVKAINAAGASTGASVTETTIAAPGGGGGGGGVPCFPAGTKLLTTAGYKAVESLTPSDAIVTADGRAVKHMLYSRTISAATEENAPYSICANAFGPSSPRAATQLSPLHAIQSKKGVWQIPQYAATMYKGVTQYGVGEKVTYYHVELPNYFTDNIVLEGGVVVESFGAKQTAGMTNVYKWNTSLKGFTRASPAKARVARK